MATAPPYASLPPWASAPIAWLKSNVLFVTVKLAPSSSIAPPLLKSSDVAGTAEVVATT
jgi:hypothetical protein